MGEPVAAHANSFCRKGVRGDNPARVAPLDRKWNICLLSNPLNLPKTLHELSFWQIPSHTVAASTPLPSNHQFSDRLMLTSDPKAEWRGIANKRTSRSAVLRHHSKTTTATHRSRPTASNLPRQHWILLFGFLLWPHPLSKQSNSDQKHWPLSKTHCFSLMPQAPSGFSSLCCYL